MRDRGQFIEHDGVRLHYRIDGSGPPVLFIHGWALDGDMWSPQFDALAAQYFVIAFDRRGFGHSTGEPSIVGDLQDIQVLLGALSVERAAIIGMSQGARTALRWTLQNPTAVSCLVLDGPPQESAVQEADVDEEPPMAAYRRLAQRSGIDAVRQAWAQHPLMQLQTSDVRAHALLRKMIARYPGHDLLNAPAARPSLPDSSRSSCPPALIINGEHDSAHRLASGVVMARWLPHARPVLVPEAGHLPNLDNPAAYNRVVGEFLRAHANASACIKQN